MNVRCCAPESAVFLFSSPGTSIERSRDLQNFMLSTRAAYCNYRLLSRASLSMAKKNAKGKGESAKPSESTKAQSKTFVIESSSGGRRQLLVSVSAVPGASSSAVAGVDSASDAAEDAVRIRVGAPPVEGEANAELVRFVAKLVNARKSDVSLAQGHRSRHKVVAIDDPEGKFTVDSLRDIFKRAASDS